MPSFQKRFKTHRSFLTITRVQAAMVPALSDRYNEIAALAEDWLSHQGESFLPLLKTGVLKSAVTEAGYAVFVSSRRSPERRKMIST